MNKKINPDEILLAPENSNGKRTIAFLSILVVYFFYCYNFMLGTFVRPTMLKQITDGGFGFTLTQASSIFSILSFSTIPGTIIFGMITTKIGKKRTLILIASTIATMTALPLLAPTNVQVWRAARFATGFALGGVFGTAVPLVAEMFKSRYRGKLAAILTSTFSVAMIFGGKVYGMLGDANWKWLVLTAVAPQVIGAILVTLFVPDDKDLTLQRAKKAAETKGEKISYLSMYKGKYLWIGIAVILLSGANFTAYSLFSNNSTTYLRQSLGLSATVAGAIFSMQGLGQLIGYNMWGWVADRFGRKVPLIGMALAGLGVFIYTRLGAQNIGMFKVVSAFLGLMIGFSGAWGAYYTELFPKRFSGLSAGISFNGGRIISTFAIPFVASTVGASVLGLKGIFYVAMSVFVAGGLLWLFLPETLNKVRED